MADLPTLDEKQLRIKKLKRDILGQQFQLSQKECAIDDKHQEIARIQADCEHTEQAIATLQAELSKLESEIAADEEA